MESQTDIEVIYKKTLAICLFEIANSKVSDQWSACMSAERYSVVNAQGLAFSYLLKRLTN